ncbi:uncharacterized protein G2W53_007125 [Senna tora]|uniref:Uncharacterized protein n=1 Tax=Senna tora TaxID=362788 RepID=A0A834X4T9_9FABA|nr:uncharacterized protein G2W53_007125 [Senna tora]
MLKKERRLEEIFVQNQKVSTIEKKKKTKWREMALAHHQQELEITRSAFRWREMAIGGDLQDVKQYNQNEKLIGNEKPDKNDERE